MKTLIILFITMSLSAFATEYSSYNINNKKSVSFSFNTKQINQHLIFDPTKKDASLKVGKERFTFLNKDLFIKKNRMETKIFGTTDGYFIHVTKKSLNQNYAHIKINLKHRSSGKFQTFNGIFKINKNKKVTKHRLSSL